MTPVVVRARDRTLSDAEYAALAGFLAREAGLVFDASRRTALAGIVADRLEECGTVDLGAYLARISEPDGAVERQRLLDAVTIPETHFFRNPPQMEALRRRLVPELMRRAVSRHRPFTVWSAGCSTGEEPYSLAVLAAEVAEELTEAPPVRIVATDVSSTAVAATLRARYSGRSLGQVDADRLARWFRPVSRQHEVRPEVREQVEVRLHNLVTEPAPFDPGGVDLIVCRNVTIYFSRDTMRALVQRFHEALAPGGYLLLGHAETLWQVTDAFTLVPLGDAFAYRKDVPAATPVPPTASEVAPVAPPVRVVLPAARSTRPAPRPVVPRPPEPEPIPDPDLAADLLAQARAAMDQARYAEAARLAQRSAQASPFELGAYLVEGQARSTVGDDRGALIALRKAVYLAPKAGHARFLLAGALSRCSEHAAAAREYRAAAATLPLTDADDLGPLLDGCDVAPLVALCRRLADESELRASEPAVPEDLA